MVLLIPDELFQCPIECIEQCESLPWTRLQLFIIRADLRRLSIRASRYALKILDHFATVANVDGNAKDMVDVARKFGTGADTGWLVQKRGANKAAELLAQSTALWALYSNSLQHEFVRSAVDKYIGQHPDEPASKALVALTQQYGYYDIRKVASVSEATPGKPSVTVNISYLSGIIDDLSRHAGPTRCTFNLPTTDRAPSVMSRQSPVC